MEIKENSDPEGKKLHWIIKKMCHVYKISDYSNFFDIICISYKTPGFLIVI